MIQLQSHRFRALILAVGCGVFAVLVILIAGVLAVLVVGASGFSQSLYPSSDIEDAPREEVLAAGYTVPGGSSHVFVKDRALQDVRVTWFRFVLSPEQNQALMDKYEVHEDCHAQKWAGQLPNGWPSFGTLKGFDTPIWWSPHKGSPACSRSASGAGSIIVFSPDAVFHLLWTWERWEPDGTK